MGNSWNKLCGNWRKEAKDASGPFTEQQIHDVLRNKTKVGQGNVVAGHSTWRITPEHTEVNNKKMTHVNAAMWIAKNQKKNWPLY